MNLSQLNHAINWWQNGGHINLPLLEKVLKAKESFTKKPKRILYIPYN